MSESPPRRDFKVVAQSEQEEQSYDFAQQRAVAKPTGVVGATAHIIKGALGAGILGCHVAYMKGGVWVCLPVHILFGIYMTFCLNLLVKSAQILYRRTKIPSLSYPDVGEASLACFPNPKVARFSRCFRYIIDIIICIDLFGSCACYQLVIAKSIKQLVENTQKATLPGLYGLPHLRVYLAILIVPIILICLITHLKWLAPFSLGANFVILICCFLAVYYGVEANPSFSNMKATTNVYGLLEFCGMIVFSMSCAGIVIPIENNMKEPLKFPIALFIGMAVIVSGTATVGFFGYSGYLDKSDTPITVNFPMTIIPKIFKGLICVMIYVTHAVNFWPPFEICFYYLQKLHSPNKKFMWELIYRTMFVVLISLVAIGFPSIAELMGFLGSFCLSNMAFIWPVCIHTLVVYERPGFGKYKWVFWRNLFLFIIGVFLLICGGLVNTAELVSVFISTNVNS